jgi:hypothetical protein
MLVMIESVVGKMAAAPMPMSARNPIKVHGELENAARTEPVPKIASPHMSVPRRP